MPKQCAVLVAPVSTKHAPRTTVTVIVPTFNRLQLLRQTLDSLRRQSCAPGQVIVVDDCSTDGTWESLVADSSLTALRTPRQGGKAIAVNLAMRHATEGVIWVFDDDDIASPTAIERIGQAFDDNPDIAFVYGAAEEADTMPDGSLGPVRDGSALPDSSKALFPLLLQSCSLGGARIAIRASVFRELQGFDESMIRSQDYELLLRVARGRTGASVSGGPLYVWRHHGGLRGTASTAFGADDRNAKWLEYDQRIFQRLRQELAPHEFSEANGNREFSRCHHLLQRCFVMATKQLDQEALEDLGASLRERNGARVDAHDIAVLERTLYVKPYYTGTALIERSGTRQQLQQLFRSVPSGRRIVLRIATRRTMRWLYSILRRKRIGLQRATLIFAWGVLRGA